MGTVLTNVGTHEPFVPTFSIHNTPGCRAVIPWRLGDSLNTSLFGGGLDMLLLGGSNEPPWHDGPTGGQNGLFYVLKCLTLAFGCCNFTAYKISIYAYADYAD